MSNTLITAYECVMFNDIDRNVDPSRFRSHISDVELRIARTQLGKTFYRAMLSDAQEFSNLASWSSVPTYVVGSKVIYRGFVYETSSVSQGENPGDGSPWSLVNKFSVTAYNDLWTDYLRKYLAVEVFSQAARFMHIQVKQKGFVKRSDPATGANQVDRGEYTDIQKHIQELSDQRYRNMDDWIKEVKDDYLDENGESYFKDYKGIDCEVVKGRPSKRQFYFRNRDQNGWYD